MKLKAVKAMTVTPEKAQIMLDEWKYTRQRAVNHGMINYYATQMANGEFLPHTDIAVAWVTNGDGKPHGYLVDGQHRLRAVVRSGIPHDFVLRQFDCASMDQVDSLYGFTDIGKARNINDMLRAQGKMEAYGLGKENLSAVSAAVTLIAADFGNRNKYTLTPTRRMEMIEQYAPAACQFLSAFGQSKTFRLIVRNSGSLAVALATFDEAALIYGEAKVANFWSGISANDGLRKGDPRKVVVDYVFIRASTLRRSEPAHKVARYVANCWNAWVTNRELTVSRVADATAPILIRGTRWNGK